MAEGSSKEKPLIGNIVSLSNHKANATEQKRNEERLKKLMKMTANMRCAECTAPINFQNAWSSISLGVFFCDKCAGIHRSLGTHLSMVKSVAADYWNDDWVDNMERWGNERAASFWECRLAPGALRPTESDGRQQSPLLKEFIASKYDQRRAFAAPAEAADWLTAQRVQLANGWERYLDDDSGAFYFYCEESGETTWDIPEAARPPPLGVLAPPPPGRRGFLEKKSGGKEGRDKLKLLQKWDRRYFVLPEASSVLSYYKSVADFGSGQEALGSIDCAGATIFLKEVTKDQAYRFTVLTKTRELKLRSTGKAEWEAWKSAFKPVVAQVSDEATPDGDD